MKIKKLFTDTLKTNDVPPMPLLKETLVEALDNRFPQQSADLQWTDREVWFKAGQRSVVEFLIKTIKEQEEE
jgi:hypothetical protein